ncbi:hypothetical protein [Streptomyces kronopolitis]|uniref:hypothetical protein n=1 Tax=Streptomyces kronopolitis TaxID=1612435 RepID=UPI00344540E8
MSPGRERPGGDDLPAPGAESFEVWAGRLAAAVAPDEADFAAATARRYAAGGRARRVLLRAAPPAPGAAGGELAAVLPALWDALAASYALVKTVLESAVFGHAVSAAGLLVALEERRRRHSAEPGRDRPATPRAAGPSPADADPAGVVAAISGHLRARGMTPADADRAAAEAVGALCRGADRAGALAFLRLLAEYPPPQLRPRQRRFVPRVLRGLARARPGHAPRTPGPGDA